MREGSRGLNDLGKEKGLMTRAEKIRAHIHHADRTLADLTDDKEIQGYLDCANLFARLEIAAQLADLNETQRQIARTLDSIAETYILGGQR